MCVYSFIKGSSKKLETIKTDCLYSCCRYMAEILPIQRKTDPIIRKYEKMKKDIKQRR